MLLGVGGGGMNQDPFNFIAVNTGYSYTGPLLRPTQSTDEIYFKSSVFLSLHVYVFITLPFYLVNGGRGVHPLSLDPSLISRDFKIQPPGSWA